MSRHYKKLSEKSYNEVLHNERTFLVTEDREEYNVGDSIVFDEFNNLGKATGHSTIKTINYIERDNEDALQKGYCILGLKGGIA